MLSSQLRQRSLPYGTRFFVRMRKQKMLYFFLLPTLIWYLMFCYMPLYGILIAFKDFKIAKGIWGSSWVGLKHFEKVFGSVEFYRILRNTLVISSLRILCINGSSIVMALLFNEVRHRPFRTTVQNLSYIPHFFSWVVIASILTDLLSPSSGLVNKLIVLLGGKEIYFLGDRNWFIPVLMISDIWQSCGWGSIIYLAAITGIDPALYEAAMMDGANRLKRMYHVTIPSIMNVIVIMLLLSLGNILSAGFNQILNLYNTRVMNIADIIDTYVYRVGLKQMKYDYATAVGVFKSVVGLILVYFANTFANKMGHTGLW